MVINNTIIEVFYLLGVMAICYLIAALYIFGIPGLVG